MRPRDGQTLRRISCAFALTVLALPNPAAAEPARPEDVKALRSCLGTNMDAAQRRHCIGILADPCLARPEGQSTVGMDMCYGQERDAWDQILNETYAASMKAFDAGGKTYLRDAQTLWIKFRDASCGWPAKVYAGGSIVGPLTAECLRDETATRALTLTDIDESQEQH